MGISLRVISTMADGCEKSLEIAAIAAATVTVVVASVVRRRKKIYARPRLV
jgi:ribosomal protein L19